MHENMSNFFNILDPVLSNPYMYCNMLEIKKLSKKFGEHQALDQIDLKIQSGEFFSLLGPSGCGKTTLLRILGGFEKASDGVVLLDQKDVLNIESFQRPFNTVFQSYALFPHLSVYENIAFGLKMKKVAKEEIQVRVQSMLELVQMQSFSDRKPETLSGGQKQRVALARALVNKPQVLLLDESLSALDLKLRKEMQMELIRLQKKLNMTFIFVTHDQEEAMTLSDRIAVMKNGRVEQVGTPQEIYNQPQSLFVADFVGAVNKLKGRLNTQYEFELSNSLRLQTPMSAKKIRTSNSCYDYVIRPEKISVHPTQIKNNQLNQLSAKVEAVIFKGPLRDYLCSIDDVPGVLLTVSAASTDMTPQFEKNQKVFLSWSIEDAYIYVSQEL